MKKQLIIIFVFFLNISFLINCSIAKQSSSSIFDSIRENLSDQYLLETSKKLIIAGQKYIIWCPNFLCIDLEIIEDNYQKDRLQENQDSRIPFDHEDIAYPLEADHIVLPIQDNNCNLIPRYALCKIILNKNDKNQSNKQQGKNSNQAEIKPQDNNSLEPNDSFCFSSQSSSNTSSPIASSAQTRNSSNTSFSRNSNSLRKKSLSQFIEEEA